VTGGAGGGIVAVGRIGGPVTKPGGPAIGARPAARDGGEEVGGLATDQATAPAAVAVAVPVRRQFVPAKAGAACLGSQVVFGFIST
jgi:hypothetical protein